MTGTGATVENGVRSGNGLVSVTYVLGAKAQLAQLIAKVVNATSLSPAVKTQLIGKLQSLVAGFDPTNAKQRTAVCVGLKAFTVAIRLLHVPSAQAADWTADANRIETMLAC